MPKHDVLNPPSWMFDAEGEFMQPDLDLKAEKCLTQDQWDYWFACRDYRRTSRSAGKNGVKILDASGDPDQPRWVEVIDALIGIGRIDAGDRQAALRSEWIKYPGCPNCDSSGAFARRDAVGSGEQRFEAGQVRVTCGRKCRTRDVLSVLGIETLGDPDDLVWVDEANAPETGQCIDQSEPVVVDSGRYFDRGGLLAKTLLTDVERLGPVASGIDGQIWAYVDGYWQPGQVVVRGRIVDLLGERYRRAHAENIESMIMARQPFITDEPVREYLNVSNGLLDWRTGELWPHSPDVPSTIRVPIRWNPEATCPNIEAFVADVVAADVVPLLYEIAGYALYADQPLHKAVMLDGSGRNGKSVYLRLLTALIGLDNTAAVPPQQLDTDRWSVAQLYGKLANLVGDVNPTTFRDTAKFKQATGQDRLQGEHKYAQPFMFRSNALMIAAFNSMPRSTDTTEGFFSRWLVVKFPHYFADPDEDGNVPAGCKRKDPDLVDRLLTTDELEGFLVLAVKGLREVMQRGQFTRPASVVEAEAEFRRHADPVRGFLAERVIGDRDAWISKSELHADFITWCDEAGLKSWSNKRFVEKVREVHGEAFGYPADERKRTGDRVWHGIRLRNPSIDDEPEPIWGHEGHEGHVPHTFPRVRGEKDRTPAPSALGAPTAGPPGDNCADCGQTLMHPESKRTGRCSACVERAAS